MELLLFFKAKVGERSRLRFNPEILLYPAVVCYMLALFLIICLFHPNQNRLVKDNLFLLLFHSPNYPMQAFNGCFLPLPTLLTEYQCGLGEMEPLCSSLCVTQGHQHKSIPLLGSSGMGTSRPKPIYAINSISMKPSLLSGWWKTRFSEPCVARRWDLGLLQPFCNHERTHLTIKPTFRRGHSQDNFRKTEFKPWWNFAWRLLYLWTYIYRNQ